jgi:hypothetical protein
MLSIDAKLCPRMAKQSPFKNDFDPGTAVLRVPLVEASGAIHATAAAGNNNAADDDDADADDVPLPFGMAAEWFAAHAAVAKGVIFFQGACPNLPTMYVSPSCVVSVWCFRALESIRSLRCLDGGTPERSGIGHTPARASSEQAWEPMASSSVNLCRNYAHHTHAPFPLYHCYAGTIVPHPLFRNITPLQASASRLADHELWHCADNVTHHCRRRHQDLSGTPGGCLVHASGGTPLVKRVQLGRDPL